MRVVIIALVSLLTVSSAIAAPGPDPIPARGSQLDAMLRAIEYVPPSRLELERQLPDAQRALVAAAEDTGRDTWTRLRAISFLSFYPDATTERALRGLLVAPQSDIRRGAVYTLWRTFGPLRDDAIANRVADVAENDPDLSVREHAVRALRWVDAPVASLRLARVGKTRPELSELVRVTTERRALRTR